jgi:hypothetical protein
LRPRYLADAIAVERLERLKRGADVLDLIDN